MHLTEISVTLKLPVHECEMNLDFVEQKWTLESVACQVNSRLPNANKTTIGIPHICGPVVNYKVGRSLPDMGPVSLCVVRAWPGPWRERH